MRKHPSPPPFLSLFSSNSDCDGPSYERCRFTQTPRPNIFTDTSFTSCSFTSFFSYSNGGVIHFTFTGTLTITTCIFTECSNDVLADDYYGGGCVCVDSGFLISHSNSFISCNSGGFGAGLLAQSDCESSVVSFCTFINCRAYHGGGLMTFLGPTSSIFASRFLLCSATWVGGAFYHDGYSLDSLTLSDSLFKGNHADFEYSFQRMRRGGGAFEDYRRYAYISTYLFSFFTQNTAACAGNDISIIDKSLSESSLVHCFTTASQNSLWNTESKGYVDWLPLGDMQYIKDNTTDSKPVTGKANNECIDIFNSDF